MRFLQNVRFSFAYLRNVHGFNDKARVSYCSMPIENCKIWVPSRVQALALSLASRVQASALALRVQALALASASTALALALVLVLQLWP